VPVSERVAFVDAHRGEFGVEPISRALEDTPGQIAPSTYYAAKIRPRSGRSIRDAQLTVKITTIHKENYDVYGARKMTASLKRAGEQVAECTVRRLMRAQGLSGLVRAKSPRTTRPAAQTDRPRDLVNREFTATAPNQLWVADITYVRTFAGWAYAAFVIDVFSRMVVGWQVSTSLYTDLALDALKMAIWRREHSGADLTGLVHHSDRGVQYRAIRYTEHLADADAVASVGSRGDSYDNALAEAFNSLYKGELVRNRGPWTGIGDLEIATAEYIDWFNNRRLHSEIGQIPPAEMETLHAANHNHRPSPQPTKRPSTKLAA
jgi:putative transposase